MNAPPHPWVALQSEQLQFRISNSPDVSTSILTPPPFLPALQDVNTTSVRVSEAEEETIKFSAPPAPLQRQEVKERLVREEGS